ncbi:MAG TPA: von Willebrand factor type A domain-containing protein [Caldilineaceae bacterium]|mgnify:CR=1 FL=1|nr:von Willebrand factor type A domain-containing protein [Caldilineaceae bacterium]
MKQKFLINAFVGLSLLLAAGGCGGAAPEAGSDESAAPVGGMAAESYAAVAASADQGIDIEMVGPRDMFFADYGINGFVDTTQDPLSTFAVDVDTGSYTLMRNYLNRELVPPAEAVRVEEFINYFDYNYANPAANETFVITLDAASSPFLTAPNHRLMRVGIQGYAIPADERQDAALTFVIDVSGSMNQENRLGLAKESLKLMVEELRPTDSVAIAVYGSTAYTILPATSVAEKGTILAAIDRLRSDGSTNAEEGLRLAYQMAWEQFNPAAINRVVLISDGVANVGRTGPGEILETIAQYAAQGITLTSVGVGMGNYNDTLMEQLANDGDGFYAYVDTLDEAHKLFVEDLTSTLQTIAKDAKVQVDFNAEVVSAYRLVGYENRDVADDDFRNDAVDAGEIGAGHSVTALYEVVLNDNAAVDATLATVHLRWEDLASGEVLESEQALAADAIAADFTATDTGFQLAATVAAYGEVLRHSEAGYAINLTDVLVEAQRIDQLLTTSQGANADVTEFVDLVWRAEQLTASQAYGQ